MGLTVILVLFGVVRVESKGFAVHVYPLAPLTLRVVGVPGQTVGKVALTINGFGAARTIPIIGGKEAPALSVMVRVYVPSNKPVNIPVLLFAEAVPVKA